MDKLKELFQTDLESNYDLYTNYRATPAFTL